MEKIKILKETWLNKTEKSIHDIEKILYSNPKKYEEEFYKLVHWIIDTNINHYTFMPKDWENAMDDACEFNSFLHNVHHAMVDDGEMTFVKVKDHGSFIVFADKNEDYFQSIVEKHLQNLGDTIKRHYESTVSIFNKTDSEKLKEVYKKRLSIMPKSLKDLEYTFHTDVDTFINDIEMYQKEQELKHTRINDMMKKLRM